jgi:ABC-type nitrate/sulfonate/bicarbonate transport system permease component
MIRPALRTAFAGYWPVLLIVAAWQVWIAAGHVARIVAPAPFDVAAELVRHAGVYCGAGGITLAVAAAGLVLGTLLGCALAVAGWFSPFVTGMLTLPAVLVQSTPLVALMPVIARLLGYDQRTVVASAALITFFPTFVLFASGLRALPPGTADLFAVLGARRLALLRLLVLPSAVPNLFVALRISSANCILAALVAEYLMGTSGLGRLFAVSESRFDTAAAWAACLVATIVSVAAFLASRRLERAARSRLEAQS